MRGANYAQLEAFVAVAERCNFKEAAAQLGVAPSTLSQTIRALEERLDVRLLNRTTRSVGLTEAGSRLLDRLKPALREIDGAIEAVHDFSQQPVGRLRVVASRAAARLVMAPAIGPFCLRHPGIDFELRIDDTLTDIVRGGFDAGVRVGHLLDQDMVAQRLTPDLPVRIVASPDYLGRRGVPQTPKELREHNCIRTGHASTGAVFHWPFRKGKRQFDFLPKGTPHINDDTLALESILSGVGIGFMLECDVRELIEAGRLVPLLESWVVDLPGLHIYYPRNRHMPAALRALLDFLKERREA